MSIDKIHAISASKWYLESILTVTIKSFEHEWNSPQVKKAQGIKRIFYEQQEKNHKINF